MSLHQSSTTFADIYTQLTSTKQNAYPVLPSSSPHPQNPALSHEISSLALHPTLEALLHILNSDLSSAHFLVRHMESRPAVEGMFVHGVLHRVEGDYLNAEAWYRDVQDSDVFRAVWPESEGGLEGTVAFIRRVEKLRKEGEGNLNGLEGESRREVETLKGFLVERFGTGRVEDATKVWVGKSGEGKKQHAGQVVGGEGWRQF
ncbi:hypothetical protein Q7P37_010650 [Cladosporium fusiforme]